jgi:hypothetical protein
MVSRIGVEVRGAVDLGAGDVQVSVTVTPFRWRFSLGLPEFHSHGRSGECSLDWRIGPLDVFVTLDWDVT